MVRFASSAFAWSPSVSVSASALAHQRATFAWSTNDFRGPFNWVDANSGYAGLVAFAGSIVALLAFPLGVASAIYLEEYARDTRLTRFIRTNVRNLAGVPSIVYGVFGLGFFVYFVGANLDKAEQAVLNPLAGTVLTTYAREVANDFHAFYRDCRVKDVEPESLRSFRLALCVATRSTLARS